MCFCFQWPGLHLGLFSGLSTSYWGPIACKCTEPEMPKCSVWEYESPAPLPPPGSNRVCVTHPGSPGTRWRWDGMMVPSGPHLPHSLIGLDLLHCSHPNPLSGLLLRTAGSRVLVTGELNHLPLPDVDQVDSVSQEGKKGYWAGHLVSSARAPYKTYQKTQAASLEPSHAAGGNEKRCSHFGKWSGGSADV